MNKSWNRQALEQRIQAAKGCGYPLDKGVQRTLEHSFGTDLSAVRLHTGSAADSLAQNLHADAFACGVDIFFRSEAYAPESPQGMFLLAHEVAHVVQQACGAVAGQLRSGDLFLGLVGDPWEIEADWIATQVLVGQPVVARNGLDEVRPTADSFENSQPLVIQRHSSFEHRLLGDAQTTDLRAIAANGPQRNEILNREINLLWLWHQNPESVTEERITQICPWVRTLRLGASGLLVTYGELNALPDYLANPMALDNTPKEILLPILQLIRQEGYTRLNSLLGRSTSEQFQYSIYAPSEWVPGFLNRILKISSIEETFRLDQLTSSLGINGVDHYQGLLARNACHFAPYSWYRWQSSYLIARDFAQRAHAATDAAERAHLTHHAWVYHGYADHFLQDSFAAGHLINKTLIMQWFVEWAANQSDFPVADWNLIKNMTTSRQPGLSGRALYQRTYQGASNDPQTSEEGATFLERMRATGIRADDATSQDIAYQHYLAFIANTATQATSAKLHDYYNENSLWVASSHHPQAYEIWGDETLLSGANGGEGAQFTSEAAQLSQQSILDSLTTGRTTTTVADIRDRFPTLIQSQNNQLMGIEAWNDSLIPYCQNNIFPGVAEIFKRIGLRLISPQLGAVSRDQSLINSWNASLPKAGYTVVNTLIYQNRLFAGSNGYVYELNPSNGQVLHSLLLTSIVGDGGDYDTRLTTDGQTLFVGVHGYIYGVSLNNWSQAAWSSGMSGVAYQPVSVLLHGNRLFAGSNGYVHELNPSNGQILHKLLLTSLIGVGNYETRLTTDGQALFVGVHGYVYSVNLSSWNQAAWYAAMSGVTSQPVTVLWQGNRLFAGSNGYVYELNPSNGQVLHSLLVTSQVGVGNYETRLATDGQTLFVGVHGYVYGVSLNNWNQVAWTIGMPGVAYEPVSLQLDGKQLFAGSNGYLCELNPSSGELVSSLLVTSTVGVGNYDTRLATSINAQSPVLIQSLVFNGSSDYARLGNPQALQFSGQITIEAWINPQATDGIRNIVAHGHTTNPNGEIYMRLINSQYQIGSWNGGDHFTGCAMPTEDVGSWVHLAGVYDGTEWILYRNGIQIAATNNSTGAIQVQENWAIGARGTGTERFFKGKIRDVRIWQVARSQADIQANMNRDLSGNESGLAGYWLLNDGTGTTAKDRTANHNHATIRGATWATEPTLFVGVHGYVYGCITQNSASGAGKLLAHWVGSYDTDTEWWGNFFSPLVIEQDGTVAIAGQKIIASYDPETSTLSFDWQDIKTTKAKGSIILQENGGQKRLSGSINPQPQDGPVGFQGQWQGHPVSTWAGSYNTDTEWWGNFFSPLTIEQDGTVAIAGQRIVANYDPETSTLSFDWQDIKTTKAKGSLNFQGGNTEKTFSGSINPQPQDGPVGFHGRAI